MEERNEESGGENSDLITMSENEARVCGEVQNNLETASGVPPAKQKADSRTLRCAQLVDGFQFILPKLTWEFIKPPMNVSVSL